MKGTCTVSGGVEDSTRPPVWSRTRERSTASYFNDSLSHFVIASTDSKNRRHSGNQSEHVEPFDRVRKGDDVRRHRDEELLAGLRLKACRPSTIETNRGTDCVVAKTLHNHEVMRIAERV